MASCGQEDGYSKSLFYSSRRNEFDFCTRQPTLPVAPISRLLASVGSPPQVAYTHTDVHIHMTKKIKYFFKKINCTVSGILIFRHKNLAGHLFLWQQRLCRGGFKLHVMSPGFPCCCWNRFLQAPISYAHLEIWIAYQSPRVQQTKRLQDRCVTACNAQG